ncbi:MAG: sulfatase-like hydrolase/transferase [Deltaproteobacteria bacterium]
MKLQRLSERFAWLRAAPVRYAFDLLLLAVIFEALSIWLTIRYPIPMEWSDHYTTFAIEVPITIGLVALARRAGLPLRWWAFLVLGVLALLVRLFETADNISHRFLYRDFHVVLDRHLIKEFFRLMYDTSQARALIGYGAAFVAFIGASIALVSLSLAAVYRRSRLPFFRRAVAAVVLLTVGIVISQELGGPELYQREISQRVADEVRHTAHLPKDRKKILKSIAEVGERIGDGVFLDKLRGNNVLMIFVESYGRTAFVQPVQRELILPHYQQMQKDLQAAGFHVASDFVTSPTYGGFSWFAHMTWDTGVKVISHLHSQILDELRPPALADRFRDAGYLPVLVMPGTTRSWPGMDDYYGFRNHYFSWQMGYRGPRYGWAPMADQYTLYRIQKAEIETKSQPLFIQYALVSSHAPFNDIPHYVDDWSTLGDGSILNDAGRDGYETSWDDPKEINEGYAAAIIYEMRMMEGYLEQYVKDDTLVIFVGDHQPHQQVTGSQNLTWSVPIHVVSRNPDFVAPFLRRGYVPGMIPEQPLPHVGMERFLEEFLSDFSTTPLAVDPGIWPPIQERMDAEAAERAAQQSANSAGAGQPLR